MPAPPMVRKNAIAGDGANENIAWAGGKVMSADANRNGPPARKSDKIKSAIVRFIFQGLP